MRLRTVRASYPFDEIRAMMRAEAVEDPEFRGQVASIIRRVVDEGDAAILKLTQQYDGVDVESVADLRLGPDDFAEAARSVQPELLSALRSAAENIAEFHRKQLERGFVDLHSDGSVLGQRILPLSRVGVYVPGGQAAYPSSLLMTLVPARVAGVESITVCSPTPRGEVNAAVLAAAHVAGATELYRIGGAQAVAALAYGTATIQAVDKIVGPGNRWVAEGKRQVFGRVDIDSVAGPSEILVIADETADPIHVAADLIGQAEHDPDAISWLVTTREELVGEVEAALDQLLERNPRAGTARESLLENGLAVVVEDLESAAAVADIRAPEHLELLVADPMALAGKIRNAGAIFLGRFTPEPFGDYYAGPNHVLPTGGTARWASPLGAYDFLKRTSLIGYSRERFIAHADDVIRLAESEGLHGHAETIRVRLYEANTKKEKS